jgi:hypothetical protein
MSDEDYTDQITQLQAQQALTVQALVAALAGQWQGAGSVEAFLYAIDPGLQGQLTADPPVVQSEVT